MRDLCRQDKRLPSKPTSSNKTRQPRRLKATGEVDGNTAVSSKLLLERFNIKDRKPDIASLDAYSIRKLRQQFALLYDQAEPVSQPVV